MTMNRTFFSRLLLPGLFFAFVLLLAPSPAHADLTSGLIGSWTLDGKDTNWRKNQTYDLSGRDTIGTLTNMSTTSTPAAGKIGQALKLDGVDDYVNAGAPSILNSLGDYTVSAWIKTSSAANYLVIASKWDQSSNGYMLMIDSLGKPELWSEGLPSSTNYIITGGTAVNDGKWHHIVGERSGATIYLFVDGVSAATPVAASTETITTASPQLIGAYWNGAGAPSVWFFPGTIDDVRIHNRALSAAEILQLFKQGQVKLAASPSNYSSGLNSDLVGYWTFDGKDTNWGSNTTNDLSIQGKTARMTNMSTTTSSAIGRVGQALKFDGTTNYVSIPSSPYSGLAEGSVALWFYANDQNRGTLFSVSNATSNLSVSSIEYSGNTAGDITFYVFPDDVSTPLNGYVNTNFSANAWHHVVITVDSSGNKTYVDGVQRTVTYLASSGDSTTQKFFSSVLLANTVRIGDRRVTSTDSLYFKGSEDDVRVYSRALSAAEITRLFRQGQAKLAASPSNYSSGLNSGLVGYWTLDGQTTNWGKNQTYDLSGRDGIGTMTNMSTTSAPVAGKIGQAMSFNGGGSVGVYVTVPDASVLRPGTGDFALSVWFKSNGYVSHAGSSYNVLAGKGPIATGNEYAISFTVSNTITVWSGGTTVAGSDLPHNIWHMATWVRRSGVSELWMDGAFVNSIASTQNLNSTSPFIIGGDSTDATRNFNGSADDVRVYNRALSTAEIAELFKQGRKTVR